MNPNDIRFQDAIPPMPQSFYERMQTTMEGMEEPMKKRYKLTTVLIAAIVAALLLAGVAVAAMQSELLKNLFPDGAPPEAEGLLIHDALSTEQEGVKLTIGEHLYDGRNFHLNWTVESARDDTVFYTVNYQLRYPDGAPIHISQWSNRSSSFDQGRGTLTGLNLTLDDKTSPKSFEGRTSNGFMVDEMPTNPWIYTLVVDVYTTDLIPVAREDALYLSETESAEYSKNRQLPIEQGQLGTIDCYPEYLAAYEWYGEYGFDPQSEIDARNRCGLLNHVASLSIPIPMNPSAAKEAKVARLTKPTTLQFRDISIAIESLEVNLSGSDMVYDIPWEEKKDYYFNFSAEFVVVDQDGASVAWELCGGSGLFYDGTMPDGTPSLRIESGGMPMPIAKVPSELRFIRIPAAIRIPNHTPLGEEVLAYLEEHPEERDEATLTLTIE